MPAILDTAAATIPAVSLFSLVIYLASSATSPFRPHPTVGIALPVNDNEPLQGSTNPPDAFDLSEEQEAFRDGFPVKEDQFWRRTKHLKIAFVVTLLPAIIWNVVILTRYLASGDEAGKQIVSIMLLPAHLISLSLGLSSISQKHQPAHWASVIHLCVATFIQFIVLSTFALLPSTPLPSPSPELYEIRRFDFSRAILPLLHFAPLLIICFVRRGPPLHFPLDAIYPPKITSAVPEGSTSLNPDIPNVSEEVQCTVPEWLLFSYATPVVRMGNERETMDVWDLPILPASLRRLYCTRLS